MYEFYVTRSNKYTARLHILSVICAITIACVDYVMFSAHLISFSQYKWKLTLFLKKNAYLLIDQSIAILKKLTEIFAMNFHQFQHLDQECKRFLHSRSFLLRKCSVLIVTIEFRMYTHILVKRWLAKVLICGKTKITLVHSYTYGCNLLWSYRVCFFSLLLLGVALHWLASSERIY